MVRPHIFFVVGHSNWGKSYTLRELTQGNVWVRRTRLAGHEYFIRRMSNDDRPDSFIKTMGEISPDEHPYILAALCPNFENPKNPTEEILRTLKNKGYKLFFWVMLKRFGGEGMVAKSEIARLKEFGKVKVFDGKGEARARSKEFKAFVISNQ